MWPTDANYYRVNIRVQMCAPDSTSTSLPHPHIQRRLVSLSRSSDTHTHIFKHVYTTPGFSHSYRQGLMHFFEENNDKMVTLLTGVCAPLLRTRGVPEGCDQLILQQLQQQRQHITHTHTHTHITHKSVTHRKLSEKVKVLTSHWDRESNWNSPET